MLNFVLLMFRVFVIVFIFFLKNAPVIQLKIERKI